mmetsp:Transcript_12601/g.28832  ORF Transcript_12601/g.28832 Transcript_12601/m.28832 type:complete len:335 (-) Transcript_12601:69-1073(-)
MRGSQNFKNCPSHNLFIAWSPPGISMKVMSRSLSSLASGGSGVSRSGGCGMIRHLILAGVFCPWRASQRQRGCRRRRRRWRRCRRRRGWAWTAHVETNVRVLVPAFVLVVGVDPCILARVGVHEGGVAVRLAGQLWDGQIQDRGVHRVVVAFVKGRKGQVVRHQDSDVALHLPGGDESHVPGSVRLQHQVLDLLKVPDCIVVALSKLATGCQEVEAVGAKSIFKVFLQAVALSCLVFVNLLGGGEGLLKGCRLGGEGACPGVDCPCAADGRGELLPLRVGRFVVVGALGHEAPQAALEAVVAVWRGHVALEGRIRVREVLLGLHLLVAAGVVFF